MFFREMSTDVISHAYVRYVEDKKTDLVHIQKVKDFAPKHETDFIREQIYEVLWKSRHRADYYDATILVLGSKYNATFISLYS